MFNDVRQLQKEKYYLIPLLWDSENIKTLETESRTVVAQICGKDGELV
jgi:hypothetical protein